MGMLMIGNLLMMIWEKCVKTQRQEEDYHGSERAGKSPDICMNRGLGCGSRLYPRPMIMLRRLQACLSVKTGRLSTGFGRYRRAFKRRERVSQDIPVFLFALLNFDVASPLWLAGWRLAYGWNLTSFISEKVKLLSYVLTQKQEYLSCSRTHITEVWLKSNKLQFTNCARSPSSMLSFCGGLRTYIAM